MIDGPFGDNRLFGINSFMTFINRARSVPLCAGFEDFSWNFAKELEINGLWMHQEEESKDWVRAEKKLTVH